jgi:hypothetical protein
LGHVACTLNLCLALVDHKQIPLPLLVDLATGACNIDISLPNPEFAVSSITSKLRFISSAIAKAAFGKCEEEFATSRHAAAVAEAVKCGADLPLTMVSMMRLLQMLSRRDK